MNYKITNQSSEVFQKLKALRESEIQMDKDNLSAIQEKVKLPWKRWIGSVSQQNWGRVKTYAGFEFENPELLDPKIWVKDKKHPECFVPNRKTKVGREMDNFLLNGLQKSPFYKVFEILDIERPVHFTFPFVEVIGDVILVFLGDKQIPKDENLIEITNKEFTFLYSLQRTINPSTN